MPLVSVLSSTRTASPRPAEGPSSPRPGLRGRGRGGALLLLVGLLAGGCTGGEDGAPDDIVSALTTASRVRAGMGVPLDADSGWAAGADGTVEVEADRPFRIRFELEGADRGGDAVPYGLEVSRNGGPWEALLARDFPYPDEISTPRVSIVSAPAYADGDATTDLLPGSEMRFRQGAGVALDSVTPPWNGRGQSEWEWPVVIRRYADGPVTNDEGDTFRFRMVPAPGVRSGTPVGGEAADSAALPTVTLTVPPFHLGGTYVETPGRLGPWQTGDGDLYFVMEPAETDNVLMVVSSPDGGRSWTEVDGGRRPTADDLEGVATALHDGTLHILHQTSEVVWHHVFRTGDAASDPDSWAMTDIRVAAPGEPPVQVAALTARSDGSLVAVYAGPRSLRIRVRNADRAWAPEIRMGDPGGGRVSGPMVLRTPDDRVHLAYTHTDNEEGTVWLRPLEPGGELGPPVQVADDIGTSEADVGSVAPLAHLPGTDEILVIYRDSVGHLQERRVRGGEVVGPSVRVSDRTVVQNAVDSDQVGADVVEWNGQVHLLFIDEETRDLYHTRRTPDGGWSPARAVVEGIDGQWVRGNVLTGPDGPVYGFVYDAGSDGGSGMNRYGTLPLGGESGGG